MPPFAKNKLCLSNKIGFLFQVLCFQNALISYVHVTSLPPQLQRPIIGLSLKPLFAPHAF